MFLLCNRHQYSYNFEIPAIFCQTYNHERFNMRNILIFLLAIVPAVIMAQKGSVLGKWKAIDDHTGEAVSIVEIFENQGKIYGKVLEIFNPADRNKKCVSCPGADKNKPLIGLTVIKGLTKDGDEYNGGEILDPKHGKLYDCYITLENANKLKVRGYIGLAFLGRTQYWHRVQ